MMTKKYLLLMCSVISLPVFSQIGINTASPKASLDINGKPNDSAVSDGVIPPRLTGNQLHSKPYGADQDGAIVYITAAEPSPSGQTADVKSPGYYYFSSSANKWIPFIYNDWHITGNSGTNPANNFLGTTDNQYLVFKQNNVQTGIFAGTDVALGDLALSKRLNYSTYPNYYNNGYGTVAVGFKALQNSDYQYARNIAVGPSALSGLIGDNSDNVAIGDHSLSALANVSTTSGSENIGIGTSTMISLRGGVKNIAIGSLALRSVSQISNNNIIIGPDGASGLEYGDNNIFIGTNASPVGWAGTRLVANNNLNIGRAIFGIDIDNTINFPYNNKAKIGIATENIASTLQVGGSFALPQRKITAQFQATLSDKDYIIRVATVNSIEIKLPDPTICTNRIYRIIGSSDNHNITFSYNIYASGDNYDTNPSGPLAYTEISSNNFYDLYHYQFQGVTGRQSSIMIQSDGQNWWLIGG